MLNLPRTNPKSRQAPRAGFTLIELLVVMSVILILAGIVIGVQRGVYRKQSEAKAKGEMQAIATALESFKLKHGDYPWLGEDDGTQLFLVLTGEKIMYVNGNNVVIGLPSGASKRAGFLDASKMTTDSKTSPTKFNDPWGNPYRYYYKNTTDAAAYRDDDPDNDPWKYPGFILVSYGPDGKTATSATTAFKDGNIPTAKEHFESATSATDGRMDDIIYGVEF